MGVTTVGGNLSSVKSAHPGKAVTAFPDVCKTPSPAGPVPIPYPNAGYGQQNTAGSKTLTGSNKMRGRLQMLNMQITSLPSGDPTRWHKLLDEYVVLTAELYKTLSE